MKTTFPLIHLVVAAGIATFATWASAEVGSATGSACETQVLPVMPRIAVQTQAHEGVKVRALVRDGAVREVQVVKGPRVYLKAIRQAMDQYRCRQQESEFWVTQEFDFDAQAR